MTSFTRTQRKYVQKAYRVRNWREYETGLRARGSLTVWLGLTDGKLANWNSPRPTRRKPGRQRQYSNHAIETTVTLGLVFGLASRQTEGFLRSLLTLLNLDNDVPDHSTISRRKARLGKVASYERRTVKPVHLRIDSSGLSVHVGQWRTPPKARDYRKLHLAVDEQTSDVVACELTSKRARDASRVASLVGQIERPIASAKADAAYDTGDVYKTLENHRAHRSPKVLIPPRKGAQLALDSAGTRQRNRNIRARSRVGKRKGYVASGYSRRSKVETTFHRYKAILGSAMRARGLASQRVEVRLGCKILNHHDGARDTRWRDDRMTGRRSHGRLSALNGVVHQGTAGADAARAYRDFWTDVGSTFPDLHGARSTAQYLEDEQWLFQTHLAPLEGLRILKTDLWDEAKNTRILGWAAAAGSRAFGVDISPGIVRGARRNFEERSLTLHGVLSDVRALPFPSGSFDAIYSMGTVEHFADTDGAVREIFRVVRPGGRVVIGVPNRWDPFLRPLLVVLLYRLGLYGYGFEKSYSRRTFRRMLTRAGFEVTAETGILFIPGWLRMLDLACYTWARPLSRLTGLAVAPFHHLSRWLPWLRRYGYLLATVAVRPAAAGAPSPQRVS